MKSVIQFLLNEKVRQEQDIMRMENEIAEEKTITIGRGYNDGYLQILITDKKAFIAELELAILLLGLK